MDRIVQIYNEQKAIGANLLLQLGFKDVLLFFKKKKKKEN